MDIKISARLVLSLVLLATLPAGAIAPQNQSALPPPRAAGAERASPSSTLLADGRELRLGGVGPDGVPTTRAVVVEAAAPAPREIAGGLAVARYGHTATLLPDGRVLIVGGLSAQGRVVPTIEIFHPDTDTFEAATIDSISPRAFHTATVVTDGRVVFAGGTSESGPVSTRIEVWDPRGELPTGRATLAGAANGLHAELLDDGRVAFSSAAGARQDDAVFDAKALTVLRRGDVPDSRRERQVPTVAATEPEGGSDDVELQPLIGIRFSDRARLASVGANTVWLESPDGVRVAAQVISVEQGRLAFLRPAAALAPNSKYSVAVAGVLTSDGSRVESFRAEFTTVGDAANPEQWIPTDTDLGGLFRTGRAPSRWQALPSLTAAAGVTALAGQVLRLDGEPLPNVRLSIDSREVRSDDTGRFLLPNLTAGHHELLVDGEHTGRRRITYGVYEIGVEIEAGKTTALSYTIWMTQLDLTHAVTIPSPTRRETVVTNPLLPGLELRLPPNAVVKDHRGQVVHRVSITPIPLDRPPFPLPGGVVVPLYFTVQPGGGYIEVTGGDGRHGGRLIYPNTFRMRPGTSLDFWDYSADGQGWFVYGKGSVTPNGQQVAPDPGVEIYELTGAMVTGTGFVPAGNPPYGGSGYAPPGGDPVDLATGLFVYSHTDLAVSAPIPITLTRTYRQNDYTSRAFGRSTSHPYDMFIQGGAGPVQIRIIMPDGGIVEFDQTAGVGNPNRGTWRFEHTKSPSVWYGAIGVPSGSGWTILLKNGTSYSFLGGGDQSSPQQGGLTSIRDRFGNVLTVSRGGGGAIYQIDSGGRYVQFTYDTEGRVIEAHDNIGRSVTYAYDTTAGMLTQVTDANGGATRYHYSDLNEMTSIEDARGITYLTNYYGTSGLLSKQTLGDGSTYRFTYHMTGGLSNQTDVVDPRGFTRRVLYNSRGYVTSDTRALGRPEQQTTTFVWDPTKNLLQSMTNPLGQQTNYTYDTRGNMLTTTRLAGTSSAATTTLTYDPLRSDPISVSDPLSHPTTFSYDSSGALIRIRDALGHGSDFTSSATGQILTVSDALSHVTHLGYDGPDVSGVTGPAGLSSALYTDAVGRMLSSVNALGQKTRYGRDALNQVTNITDPSGAITAFGYDGNGNLLTLTDANGNTTSYSYNNMDRVVRRTDALGRSDLFEYDAVGNTTKTVDRRGAQTTFTFDALNRVVSASVTVPGQPSFSRSVTYAYDALDRVTQLVDSQSGTITRSFDDLARTLTETTSQGHIVWTFDAAGRRTAMDVSGQPTVTYAYDDADRLTGVTQGTSTVAFEYDNADRRTLLTLPDGLSATYSYNDSSLLTGITFRQGATALGTLTYTYDALGRRTSVGGSWARTGLPAPITADYDVVNQVLRWGTASLSYDSSGNLLTDGANTYSWDGRHQLAGISGSATATFQYDALGRRSLKTVGGASTQFRYDGLNVVEERDGGGAVTATQLVGLGLDDVYRRTAGSSSRNLMTDALGSVVAEVDPAGSATANYTYEPFGNTTASAGSTTPGQWTARENDGTGLYYFRARYYSPTLSRFIGEDPLGFAAGDMNLHGYAFDSPTNFTDPTGKIVPAIVVAALWSCGGGAVIDTAINAAENWIAGRKSISDGTGGAALRGCVSGLIGEGIGTALRSLLSAGAHLTTLYRVVNAAEAEEAVLKQALLPMLGQFEEGKWFAKTAEEAMDWGTRINKGKPFNILEVKLPTDQVNTMTHIPIDGINAVYGELKDLSNAVIRLFR